MFEGLVILNKQKKIRQPQSYLSSVLFHLVSSLLFSCLPSCLLLSLVLPSLVPRLAFTCFLCLCLSVSVCCCVCCGVCCGVCCACVVVCVVCVVVCGVAHWKNPCADSKRSRVYVQNVSTRTCVATCGRGAGTHGDVLNLHTASWREECALGRGSRTLDSTAAGGVSVQDSLAGNWAASIAHRITGSQRPQVLQSSLLTSANHHVQCP